MKKMCIIFYILFILNLTSVQAQHQSLTTKKFKQVPYKINTKIEVMTMDEKQKDYFFLENIEIVYDSFAGKKGTKPTISLVLRGKTPGQGVMKNCIAISDEIPIIQAIYQQIMALKRDRILFKIVCKGNRLTKTATQLYLKSWSPVTSTLAIIHNY